MVGRGLHGFSQSSTMHMTSMSHGLQVAHCSLPCCWGCQGVEEAVDVEFEYYIAGKVWVLVWQSSR